MKTSTACACSHVCHRVQQKEQVEIYDGETKNTTSQVKDRRVSLVHSHYSEVVFMSLAFMNVL